MRTLRRIHRHIVHRKKHYLGAAVVIILLAISVFYLTASKDSQQEIKKEEQEQTEKIEITSTDILSMPDFNSKKLSVMGIQLGDTKEKVIETIGVPDSQTSYPPSIVNMEYSKRIELDETGLLIHFENDIATRITLREPFSKYLIGKTKITLTKDQVYGLLGKPDETKHLPVSENSPLVYRVFIYKDKGLEALIRRDKEIGLSFAIY